MAFKPAVCILGATLIIALALLPVGNAEFTEEEKAEIVKAHNYYRGMVDPIATNMEMMVSII